jgi:hypothetical protein
MPVLMLVLVLVLVLMFNNLHVRFAYFTIPLTSMAAGWMGGLELSKIAFGRWVVAGVDGDMLHCRDDPKAWVTAAVVPGGIMGIWSRHASCHHASMRHDVMPS